MPRSFLNNLAKLIIAAKAQTADFAAKRRLTLDSVGSTVVTADKSQGNESPRELSPQRQNNNNNANTTIVHQKSFRKFGRGVRSSGINIDIQQLEQQLKNSQDSEAAIKMELELATQHLEDRNDEISEMARLVKETRLKCSDIEQQKADAQSRLSELQAKLEEQTQKCKQLKEAAIKARKLSNKKESINANIQASTMIIESPVVRQVSSNLSDLITSSSYDGFMFTDDLALEEVHKEVRRRETVMSLIPVNRRPGVVQSQNIDSLLNFPFPDPPTFSNVNGLYKNDNRSARSLTWSAGGSKLRSKRSLLSIAKSSIHTRNMSTDKAACTSPDSFTSVFSLDDDDESYEAGNVSSSEKTVRQLLVAQNELTQRNEGLEDVVRSLEDKVAELTKEKGYLEKLLISPSGDANPEPVKDKSPKQLMDAVIGTSTYDLGEMLKTPLLPNVTQNTRVYSSERAMLRRNGTPSQLLLGAVDESDNESSSSY